MSRAILLVSGFLPFIAVQLVLGNSAATSLLSALSLVAGFLPFMLWGRDLYAILAAVFALRYVGISLIAKTCYGETLDSNLHDPVSAYLHVFCFMGMLTAILIIVRSFDHGRGAIALPGTADGLGRAAVIAGFIGIAAQAVVIAVVSRRAGTANIGGIYIIAAHLSHLYLLALALECDRTLRRAARPQLIGVRLVTMLLVAVLLTMLLNMREFFVDCLIVVGVTGFLHRALGWRHIVFGVIALMLASAYLSPMVLAVRSAKYGQSPEGFVTATSTVIWRSVTDQEYRETLVRRQRAVDAMEKDALLYDYYGDGSNLLNRLSYVALTDAVLNAAGRHDPIGMPAMDEVWDRVVPRFLAADKRLRPYEYGDWLCWKLGLMANGRIYAANFGLPMEGVAVAGPPGFLLFPVLFLIPALGAMTRLASFRKPTAMSIFLFATFQHPMVEAASDGFVLMLTRALPLLAVCAVAIFYLARIGVAPKPFAYSAASLTN